MQTGAPAVKIDLGEPLRLLYRGRQIFSDAFADGIQWWHPRFPRIRIEPHLQEKLRAGASLNGIRGVFRITLGDPVDLSAYSSWLGWSIRVSNPGLTRGRLWESRHRFVLAFRLYVGSTRAS